MNLDLTRGKPSTEQVALSDSLDCILAGDFIDGDGIDVRNYGGLTGLREARELFAAVLGSDPANTLPEQGALLRGEVALLAWRRL